MTRLGYPIPDADLHAPPGSAFVRCAIAMALGRRENVEAAAIAAKRWGADSQVVRILRSGVAAGSSGGWGAPLTDASIAQTEFADLVRPLTVLGKLQGLRVVPPNVPFVATTTGAVAHWTGQGKAAKVSAMAFARSRMAPLKITAMVVIDNELLANSKPEAEALIRRDLVAAVVMLSDETFLNASNAGSAGSMPAAVTYGASSVASSGNLADDLEAAVDRFHGDFTTAAWVMSPRVAAAIALATDAHGFGGDIGLRGGALLGLPAYVSAAAGTFDSNGGQIALVDPANIVAVDEGAEVAISKQARIELDDSPSGDTLTPAAASGHVVSLFQEEATALLVSRRINWQANSGAVVIITGANYSSAS